MAGFKDLLNAAMRAGMTQDFTPMKTLVQGGLDPNVRDSMMCTVLHFLVGAGTCTFKVMEQLLELGANINAVDINGETPLHCALSMSDCFEEFLSRIGRENLDDGSISEETNIIDVVVWLCQHGADINAKYSVGKGGTLTSLHRAILLDCQLGVETLVRLGVDVNEEMYINLTALHLAIDGGKMRLFRKLVELGADINNPYSIVSPIHEAVESGRMEIVKILVENGADVNALRFDNRTHIFDAVSSQNTERIKNVAKSKHVDLNMKTSRCQVVYGAVKIGRTDMVEYLVNHEADISHLTTVTPLGYAVKSNFCTAVEPLASYGANVNVEFEFQTSLLAVAVRQGDTDMVKTLVNIGMRLNHPGLFENHPSTALYIAIARKYLDILKLLLKNGGNINARFIYQVNLVHEAVANRDCEMLEVLGELGADMNASRYEGLSLLAVALDLMKNSEQLIPTYEMLLDKGIDLNLELNSMAPVHDAVRLKNIDVVQTLGRLKVDLDQGRPDGWKILHQATVLQMTDLIRYLAEKGADMNASCTTAVTPLHDAVRLRNIEMVCTLIKSGAHRNSDKNKNQTAIVLAVEQGLSDVVQCLVDCKADVNAKAIIRVRALHDAVEYSDLAMSRALVSLECGSKRVQYEEVGLLHYSIVDDYFDVTETLLKCGVDKNCKQVIRATPLDVALRQGKCELAAVLSELGVPGSRDSVGESPLHTACQFGHLDQVRLLIFEGCDVNKYDNKGLLPLQCLPLADRVAYCVLKETLVAENVAEEVLVDCISVEGCQDVTTLLSTPGIGGVQYISSPSSILMSEKFRAYLESTTSEMNIFIDGEWKPVGSTAEGTRVGLPNEMDFLFEMPMEEEEEAKVIGDFGHGFVEYNYGLKPSMKNAPNKAAPSYGSAFFHDIFIKNFGAPFVSNLSVIYSSSDEELCCMPPSQIIRSRNRKACSKIILTWTDNTSSLLIPVDLVPSLHINSWPEGGATKTWLMDEGELRSRGYVLVPKPPHVESNLAKECTEDQLQSLWKISFPHLETEHMQRLEQRIKDVYLAAKCLRNPDACRILITDNGSLPRNVDKYITSYLLKMCFFKNVEDFHQADLGLEEMVCKVYQDLEEGLSKGFIPLYFLPKVSALDGTKLDVPKSAKVAKIMSRFVRALSLRDCQSDRIALGMTDEEEEVIIYQRKRRSVYRTYEISSL